MARNQQRPGGDRQPDPDPNDLPGDGPDPRR